MIKRNKAIEEIDKLIELLNNKNDFWINMIVNSTAFDTSDLMRAMLIELKRKLKEKSK